MTRCTQGNEQSTHTFSERTQRESQHRGNTIDGQSPSHMHRPTWTVYRHPFVDRNMEVDISLRWKPLNLEWYDGTTDLDEHIDAFLTQANLYTNNDAVLCCVFPMSLKGAALTRYDRLPPMSIESFDTLIERFSAQYATSRSYRMTLAALASLRQADDESLKNFVTP